MGDRNIRVDIPTGWVPVAAAPGNSGSINILDQAAMSTDSTSSGGLKYDSGKPRMDLLPAYSLEQIALVLGFGASKYSSWNWSKGIAYSRLLGAALRHLFAYARGEDKDPESGLSHLAHAGCCVLFLIWMDKYKQELDDRSKDPA